MNRLIALLTFWLATLSLPVAADGSLAGVEVVGSDLRIHAGNGRTIRGNQLVGAELTATIDAGLPLVVRIDAVSEDPKAADDDVIIYDLSVQQANGEWHPACEEDPYGERHAILQASAHGGVEVWCTFGTFAKCVRFGYRPWASGPNGESLRNLHRACAKMLRADYCGNDQPTTRNGMWIEFYDKLGKQEWDRTDKTITFEAAWNEAGAICVAKPRVPQNIDLEQLAANCPRLHGKLGEACTEESAGQYGTVLLFNGSRGDGITEAERTQVPD
ncbi:MAG: ADYC domain-containing protein [Thiolinea sp.]